MATPMNIFTGTAFSVVITTLGVIVVLFALDHGYDSDLAATLFKFAGCLIVLSFVVDALTVVLAVMHWRSTGILGWLLAANGPLLVKNLFILFIALQSVLL
jgi:hypothetical protein